MLVKENSDSVSNIFDANIFKVYIIEGIHTPRSVVVARSAHNREGPGSIPGRGKANGRAS